MANIEGTESADNRVGTSLSDFIFGFGGNDTLSGLEGADRIDGGTGNDVMIGGLGDDAYVVDSALDQVTEEAGLGSGIDTILGSVSLNLSSTAGTLNVENLTLTGFAFSGIGNGINNTLSGNDLGNLLSGLGGSDNLFGFGGNDTLDGGTGFDTVVGGAGGDIVNGGLNADTLTGDGPGLAQAEDFFRFDTAIAGNVDRITDFSSAFDTIQLDDDIFGSLGQRPGDLAGSRFKANAAGVATDKSDRIIYETDTGMLRYDPDGNGSKAPVLFAQLSGAPGISASDFDVIA